MLPDKRTRVRSAQPSLDDLLLALEPYVAGQEVIPDTLLAACQQLADAGTPDSPLLRELQQHFDRFEHAEALAKFTLLTARQREPR
jgi:hypothetical protein